MNCWIEPGPYGPIGRKIVRGTIPQPSAWLVSLWRFSFGQVIKGFDFERKRIFVIRIVGQQEAHGVRADLVLQAETLTAHLRERAVSAPGGNVGEAEIRAAVLELAAGFDQTYGGFGPAPKFPPAAQISLLLRHHRRTGDAAALAMATKTLDGMAQGGMYDQIGGGFARYSVDAEWLVPHFEKMLYDNAQLLNLNLDAYLVSREARFASVARDIIRYIQHDMTHPEGGFYSAEDADSEGHEGKFYCWTHDELSKMLTPEEFNVTVRYFGITKAGNFVDHSHPSPLPGQNVLSVVEPIPSGRESAQTHAIRAD